MQSIEQYFPNLSEEQKSQYTELQGLYVHWNAQINVISRKDIENLYTHHVLHSLAIAKFISFPDEAKVIDVGTGGGFPGIPLAIMFPRVQFHLVDATAKKLKVVAAVAEAIGLENVTYEHNRCEKVKGRFDFGVARAVAPTPKLHGWTKHLVQPRKLAHDDGGLILLKGGDLTEEMQHFHKAYQELPLTNYFSEPFFETKKLLHILM